MYFDDRLAQALNRSIGGTALNHLSSLKAVVTVME